MSARAITITITDTTTGESRSYPGTDSDWWPDGGSYSWWSSGNFSCDCNRYLCFQRARAEDEEDFECSDYRFRVRINVDGAVVFDDHDGGEDAPNVATTQQDRAGRGRGGE